MKKLTLSSVFSEDGMHFHNRVFRVLHGYLRNTGNKIILGISEDRSDLYFYAEEDVLQDFLSQKDIANLVERNVYDVSFSASQGEQSILLSTRLFDPVKKAKMKHQYYKKVHGAIDEQKAKRFTNIENLINHYREQLNARKEIYFIGHKKVKTESVNGEGETKKISFFAQRAQAPLDSLETNTYGLVLRKSL